MAEGSSGEKLAENHNPISPVDVYLFKGEKVAKGKSGREAHSSISVTTVSRWGKSGQGTH